MLQPIELKKRVSSVEAFITQANVIARDAESGATLEKSPRQYTLIVEQPSYLVRHWSRGKVQSDQEAIEKANKALEKILNEPVKPE